MAVAIPKTPRSPSDQGATQGARQSGRPSASETKKLLKPRVPPHSLEAEQSVLGALLIDHRAWDSIADRIAVQDFYRDDHQTIFQAIADLIGRSQPCDVVTVADQLKSQQLLDAIGGEAYLFELASYTPTAANVAAYADIVRERSVLRQLIRAGTDIVDNAFNLNGMDAKEVLDVAERHVFQISETQTRGSGPVKISTLMAQATDKIDELYHSGEVITGLATGFTDLDNMTAGLQNSDMIVVAGRPSMGKTTFAMNIVTHAVVHSKKPALVFSLEMPGEQLAMRLISSLARIEQTKVRTGKLEEHEWPQISSAVSLLDSANLYIDDTPGLLPSEMRARARRVARKHNNELGLIMVDYLQLMRVSGSENRTAEISEISRSLKSLAKELNVPIIACSQLNRSLEQRQDKRPVMSDLRESGAIEQDADLILFIYRDEVYNPDTPDKGIAEVLIRKHRNGPIGDLRTTFQGQYALFENYTDTQEIPGSFV